MASLDRILGVTLLFIAGVAMVDAGAGREGPKS
jgi:hypothetical protein